ncbi:MAG: dCMP deaminase family protein [Solirubrobacteraceae bacterium]
MANAGARLIPEADPSTYLPRIKQVQWDHYYVSIARTVETRANCFGTHVGAVLVLNNRIISTGFNGTPEGFQNCEEGGCTRCSQRELKAEGRVDELKDPLFGSMGKHLDVCVCVHAEANALLSAARYGTRTQGATLYSTWTPCFTCLKEAIQAGVERVVYLKPWSQAGSEILRQQYALLAEHLRGAGGERNFEQLHPQAELLAHTGGRTRDPVLDDIIPENANGVPGVTVRRSPPAEPVPAPTTKKSAAKRAAAEPRRAVKPKPAARAARS